MSRPFLGGTVLMNGFRGSASFAPGMLVHSLRPTWPIYLGTGNCYAWFDLGHAMVASLISCCQNTWNWSYTVPNAPQLQGLSLALQSVFVPTPGPRGFELSRAATVTLQ